MKTSNTSTRYETGGGRALWLWVLLAIVCAAVTLLLARPAHAQRAAGAQSVVNTPHNLSASGPGAIRATSEQEVCVFCHTPHRAAGAAPLWNRSTPVSAYKPYASNSLKAQPGQPTGSSKLCLSCHDGTIALGAVNSRGQAIEMAGGMTALPPGARSNLGTDLSDDHPVSFRYDAALAAKNPKLRDPGGLTGAVKLDANGELQCGSCHDAHNNQYGKFLVTGNASSELCKTCHTPGATDVSAHAPCANCHQSHTAPSGPYLLTKAKVSDTCLGCHGGQVGQAQGPNIADVMKSRPHDTGSEVNLSAHVPNNVDCKDCHEQHSMGAGGAALAPAAQPALGKVGGVSAAGATLAQAQNEYEVCFKCHADQAATLTPLVTRQITQPNFRLKTGPSAVSRHPVTTKGVGADVPSLRPPLTTASQVYCTDCHGSDASKKAGGTGPNGPHGSQYPGLLLARYDVADYTSYSTGAYALCFTCHDNTKVVADGGPFPLHKKHVVDAKAPCATCHDSHGVASAQGTANRNGRLINFNIEIVQKNAAGKLEIDLAGRQCYLKCHGVDHNPKGY